MNTARFKIFILLLFFNVIIGCDGSGFESIPPAKNIILFIGDGMGEEHRKAACWFTVGKTGTLSMDHMPIRGAVMTNSADNLITDSAAAATAMATGVKTSNGRISIDINMNQLPTILENAKSKGKSVGLVTTTQITHATPAAFASHVESRKMMADIAEQFLITGVDVLMGGGEDEFLPSSDIGCFPEAGEREDGRNLITESIDNGYEYVCDFASLELIEPSTTFQLIGLFADEGITHPFSPSLADMTQKAIDILSKNNDGFFLMVEGGQIDWASHDNDATKTISNIIGLDDAVEVAKQFASIADDTLLIVVADHETGGMVVSSTSSGLPTEDGPFSTSDGSLFYVNWSTTGHTSANVPVTSQGPLSEMLIGVHENTYIYDVMLRALGED